MKRKKNGLLKRLQWRAECLAFLAVERLLNLFPLATLWSAGAGISGVARIFASRWPTVRNNLRTVLGPEAGEEAVSELTREVFRHTAANLLTALKGAQMKPDQVRDALEITNPELAERALHRGKGIVFVTGHMGNWEFLAQAMGSFRPDVKIGTLYRPLNNTFLDKVIRDRRERKGMRLFAKLTSFHAPIHFVKKGNILGLLVDQRAGRLGTLTPFFGRLMSMSPLPEFIHKHTGASILGVSMVTTAPGKWRITFHDPKLAENESFTTPHLAALLEEVIRESVVDEFWMQNLWRTNQRRPLEIRGRTGPVRLERDRDQPLYPFSVLVRTPDTADRFAEITPALAALAASRPDMEVHLLARETIRSTAASSAIPHTFHALEDDHLPEPVRGRLQAAIVLTDNELAARELAPLFSGPTYSLPGIAQSSSNWHPVDAHPDLPPTDQWLEILRSLGMHDPPLAWEYL